jgi:hypothetical protein
MCGTHRIETRGGDSIYGATLTRQQRVRKENQVKVQQTGKPDLSDFLENWSPLQGEPVCKSHWRWVWPTELERALDHPAGTRQLHADLPELSFRTLWDLIGRLRILT